MKLLVVILMLFLQPVTAAGWTQEQDDERGSHFEPIAFDITKWSFARVGPQTPVSAVADRRIEAIVHQSLPAGSNARLIWEGAGSGLIVQLPSSTPYRQQRIIPDETFLHTQWEQNDQGIVINRTWWVRYDPAAEPSRGVVVLLPGMLSTPEPIIEGLVLGLRAERWTVLRMLAHPSRYTEDTFVQIDEGREPRVIAAEFASLASDRIMSMVTSVSAALEAHRERPGQRVLVAMSGGTLSTPAILSELDGVFSAAVLIGAGADVLTMSETSTYAGFLGGLRLAWDASINPDVLMPELVAAYRAIDSLDPYHTAPRAGAARLLMIQGASDKAVPSTLGDLLWERLGRPERWLADAGHEVLFFGYLPLRSRDLLRWLSDASATEHGAESHR